MSDSGRCYEENKTGLWWSGVVGLLPLLVRNSPSEAGTFELRLVGANFEVWEKGILGRDRGRVSKFKCTHLERERKKE